MSPVSRLERLCWWVVWIVVINWMSCAIIATAIGGDGWGVPVENGRYFVESHGTRTEVSKTTYYYTKVHLAVSFALAPLLLIAGVTAALLGDHRKTNEADSRGPSGN